MQADKDYIAAREIYEKARIAKIRAAKAVQAAPVFILPDPASPPPVNDGAMLASASAPASLA